MKYLALLFGTLLVLTPACQRDAAPSPSAATASVAAVAPTVRATESTTPAPAATEPAGLDSPRVAPFRRMADALNRGDATAALSQFSDDAVWERGGQCPATACAGKQAVQRELTRDVTAHHQLTLLSADTTTSAPTVRLELRNDGTRRANVDRVIQFFAFETKDDKISSLRVSFDLSDAVTARFVASQAGTQR